MDLIYNGNHILRKSFNLSLNEWAVLCDIKDMSQNQKYNYWCIKSKSRIADWLDLSERTVFNAIETLFLKNLIQKNELGYLKISQMLMDMCSTQDGIGIYIKGDDFELISARVKSYVEGYAKNAEGMQKMQSTYAKNAEQPMQNLHTSINISTNNSTVGVSASPHAPEIKNETSLKTPLSDPYNKKKNKQKKEFEPPKVEEVIKYFEEKGYKKEAAIKAFNFYEANEWKDSNDKPVVSWKQKMVGAWFKTENEKPIQNDVCPYTPAELTRFRKLRDSDLGLPTSFDKKWEYLLKDY